MPTCSTQAGESILEGSSTLSRPSIFVDEDKIPGTDVDCSETANVITPMSTAAGSHDVVVGDCNEESDVNGESAEPERSICDLVDDDSEIYEPSAAEAMLSTQWVGISSSVLSGSINIAAMAAQSFIDAAIDDHGEAAVNACKESQYNRTENKERYANEALQSTSLPDLPQVTESTAGIFYLPKSSETFGQNISSESGDSNFIVSNENRMGGSSGENENFPTQVSEMKTQIIQGTDEQDKDQEMMGSPTGLQSTPETHNYPHVKQEIDCAAVESMHSGLEFLSEPLLLQEGSNESHNNAVALTGRADAMETFICLKATPDISQNEARNNNTLVNITNDNDLILLTDSDPAPENTNHVSVLQKAMDKHCNTTVMMPAGGTSDQQGSVMSPDSSDSPITNGSESQECIAAFNLKVNVANIDSWYAEESLKGLTYQDVQGIWEPSGAENSAGFSSAGSKENQADAQNSTLLKVHGMPPIFEKELCTGYVDTRTDTATANAEDEPATDFTDRGLVPTNENIQGASENEAMYSSYLENRLQATECFSCPLLYSWNDHSADELDFQQFATAEESPEEKKELELQRNSYNSDDPPKISLERNCSENVRRPLCNLFAEDSFSDCEERAPSTEQTESGPLVTSVKDVWTSPPARPTSRDKHKARSIFRYCICLPAVH